MDSSYCVQSRKKMQQDFYVETKTNELDLVTNIDKEVQADFTKLINEYYPDHQLMGKKK